MALKNTNIIIIIIIVIIIIIIIIIIVIIIIISCYYYCQLTRSSSRLISWNQVDSHHLRYP